MYRRVINLIVVTAAITLSQRPAQAQIPLPVGQYSITGQGTLTRCVNPNTLQQEACGTSGELIVPEIIVRVGVNTLDQQGNNCVSAVDVTSPNIPPLYPILTPPIVTPDLHVAGKVLDYDPSTGSGDSTFTVYTGGTCTGGTFNSTGAKEVSSGLSHFVVTQNGSRYDAIVTKVTNPANSTAGFSYSVTGLSQQ